MTPTVLVVEDDADLREMICEALTMSGYKTIGAKEGKTALQAIPRIEHLCMVLLDLFMPGMNGWDFFEELRARPDLAKVPVIVHTSAPEQAPAGATAVLEKPVDLNQLLDAVGQHCARQAAS